MAIHLQIDPRAEAVLVGPALAAVLDGHVQDFELRYCALEPDAHVIDALRSIEPATRQEADAIATLLARLEVGEPVEMIYG